MKRMLGVLMLVLVSMATPPSAGAQSSPAEIAILKKKAAAGDATAQLRLGTMYDRGRGVPEDKAEAVRWYRLVAFPDVSGDSVGSVCELLRTARGSHAT